MKQKIIIICCMLLCAMIISGCKPRKSLADIKVEALDSALFTEAQWDQILEEFVKAFNEEEMGTAYQEVGIEAISYVSDECLKQEISDWLENENNDPQINENTMDFMLVKVKLDTLSLKDSFNFADSYPNDYYYFIGKKQNEGWKVLRAGLAYGAAYGLQCELPADK